MGMGGGRASALSGWTAPLVLVVVLAALVPLGSAAGADASDCPVGGSTLSYLCGHVMVTNRTYAIYWSPASNPVAAGYRGLVDRYLRDVAASSGAPDNVYAI